MASLNTSADPIAPSLPAGLGAFAGRGRGVRESGYSSSDGSAAPGARGEDGEDEERESSGKGLPLTGDMARYVKLSLSSAIELMLES